MEDVPSDRSARRIDDGQHREGASVLLCSDTNWMLISFCELEQDISGVVLDHALYMFVWDGQAIAPFVSCFLEAHCIAFSIVCHMYTV